MGRGGTSLHLTFGGNVGHIGLSGLKIWVSAMGCRSNLYEGETLAGELLARGALICDLPDGADAAVIVSCSVTGTADKKCRQAVRRARRALPADGVLAVCGCWAQGLDSDEASALGIDILLGNRLKHKLADLLESAANDGKRFVDMRADLSTERHWDSLVLDRPVQHTRTFLKIQEGCDHFCSYCVIPFLRGRSTSRPAKEALDEIRRVLDSGCREIVLTGIHLGMYGKDTGDSLPGLIRDISRLSGIGRLRMGSLEPFSLSAELLDALAESPVFCPHLHLPLQSGDDEVLQRMRRGHTGDDYIRICDLAREKLGGDLHISSDVMVGFPGESDEAFERTLAVMRRTDMGRVHVFPYSPRKGTLAAAYPNRLRPETLAARTRTALTLGEELLERYASRFVGRIVPVLAEEVRETRFDGYTPHFVSASVSGAAEKGTETDAKILSCSKGELTGCPA